MTGVQTCALPISNALAQDLELIGDFVNEAGEHLAIIESQILILERDPTAADPLNAAFRGFGRCGTDENGAYAFDTIKPGQVPDPDGKPQAPHILLAVFARGMLRHLYTRIYFGDEAANSPDPVLAMVPAERRSTLIAARESGNGNAVYRLDLRLQGDDETVFFDI